jgi:MFS family permease
VSGQVNPAIAGMPPVQTRASFAAWFALVILTVTMLYAVIDRQVLALLAQPLKTDLGLSDTQIGSLQGLGAALFAGIAVYPLGWLADRMDRRLLLALCILVWSTAIAACGFATGYWTLLLCVAFLGAGEAGLSPIVFALIPELFPERQRMTANFVFYSATVLGAGVGVALAGAVIDHIGLISHLAPQGLFTQQTWRLVFLVVAIPAPFLAIAVGLIRLKRRAPRVRPEAGETSPPAEGQPVLAHYLAQNWRGVVSVFLPYGLTMLGVGAIFGWMPIILMRAGLSAGDVGAGFGAAVTAGSVGGLAVAAIAARYLKPRWGALTPVRVSMMGYLIFALLAPLHLFTSTPTQTFVIAGFQMAMAIGGNSLMPTLVQDLAPGPLRGRVFALSTVMVTILQVISPLAVGLLSDNLYPEAGGLLKAAITVGFPCVFTAALMLRFLERHIMATVDRVRAQSGPDEAPVGLTPQPAH